MTENTLPEDPLALVEAEIKTLTETQAALLNHPVVGQLRALNAQLEICTRLRAALSSDSDEEPPKKTT